MTRWHNALCAEHVNCFEWTASTATWEARDGF
jgi:hypothetical protein